MPHYTTNLSLYEKDPSTDGADTFNITTMMNENWDKLDTATGKLSNLTTTAKTNLVAAINENASSLADKVDKSSLTEVSRYITAVSDESIMPRWWIEYNDGWVEQGGHLSGTRAQTATFIKTMKDANYTVNISPNGSSVDGYCWWSATKYTGSLYINIETSSNRNFSTACDWSVAGYKATT